MAREHPLSRRRRFGGRPERDGDAGANTMSTLLSPNNGEFNKPWGKGVVTWVRDAAANDSNKSFTVPAGKVWLLKMVYAVLVNTATVGNRVLVVDIYNSTPTWVFGTPRATSTAGQYCTLLCGDAVGEVSTTATYVPWAEGGSGANVSTLYSFPTTFILTAGMIIKVWDGAAVDAAADDLTVNLFYIEYDA